MIPDKYLFKIHCLLAKITSSTTTTIDVPAVLHFRSLTVESKRYIIYATSSHHSKDEDFKRNSSRCVK